VTALDFLVMFLRETKADEHSIKQVQEERVQALKEAAKSAKSRSDKDFFNAHLTDVLKEK